ncbi:hypothetical protein [Moraxella oblonga]|nr:hypothetical protein [Moraxella oblonga]
MRIQDLERGYGDYHLLCQVQWLVWLLCQKQVVSIMAKLAWIVKQSLQPY